MTPSAWGQTSLGLSAELYAGLTVTGAVGTACEVQYRNSLGDTNQWFYLADLILTNGSALVFDPTPATAPRRFYRAVVVPTNMVLISAGAFQMGDPFPGAAADQVPVHSVSVSGFYMDRTEVSKALWDEVKGWADANGYGFENAGSGKAANHPVQALNWYDAVKWCNARSEREGLSPVYYTDEGLSQIYRSGQLTNPHAQWGANGYRLPTEAEWEKAARGGSSGHRYPWVSADTITHAQANYYSTNLYAYDVSPTRGYHPAFNDGVWPYTCAGGYFAPNGQGLCEMAGNVAEWCWDWYDSSWYGTPEATQNDTRGPVSGTYRVLRGSSWDWYAYALTCSCRTTCPPYGALMTVGFRCVRRQ